MELKIALWLQCMTSLIDDVLWGRPVLAQSQGSAKDKAWSVAVAPPVHIDQLCALAHTQA